MKKIIEQVRVVLEKYNILIFSDYPVEKQHVFLCEGVIIFVDNNSISLSFFAGLRPEIVANNTLILTETGVSINIMESFVYNEEKQIVCGDQAFELLHEKIAKQKVGIKDKYTEFLEKANCFTC
jgi:hypothetical protein